MPFQENMKVDPDYGSKTETLNLRASIKLSMMAN